LILVLVEARPRLIASIVNLADAILMAYLPGPEGGQAIAEILFGIINPSGKLSFTYPRLSGDIGVPYYKRYSDTTSPLFEFGTGLSYTTFSYTQLQLSPATIKIGQNLTVSVTLTNTGSVAGREAVLLYLSDLYASITPEVKLLKRFEKVFLNTNQNQIVSFTLTSDDFSFIGLNNVPVVEPGQFTVTVGSQTANFVLTA